MKMGKIKSVVFVYLTQEMGEYYVTDDPGYSVQRRPQLGLQYLCAVLEKKGIKTNIFDQSVDNFKLNELVEKLKEFDIVGFYCSDPQEEKVKKYCGEIKKKLSIKILVGGPSTLTNASFLEHGCDIVVHGEGEITIQEIVEYYNKKKKIEKINGISYMKNGKIVTNKEQELIENLDELPFPDRSKVPIDKYYDWFLFGMKLPYATMIASRGCLYKCAFCTSNKIWGLRYRQRSVENVLEEIDEVVKKYKIRYIAFQDDIFGITNKWIEEFCTKLMKKPYKIRWMVILHPFSIPNEQEKILRLMKKAGCDTLSMGLQTAHKKILKNINRNPEEPEKLKKLLENANKLGFITSVGFIFGLPGDTKETIQTTIDYSINCKATLCSYYILSVLRGSELERRYRGKKITALSNKEIEELTIKASRKFYMNLRNLMRIAYFILKNPSWIFSVGLRLPSILARVGF